MTKEEEVLQKLYDVLSWKRNEYDEHYDLCRSLNDQIIELEEKIEELKDGLL